jgi:hypothetical protein
MERRVDGGGVPKCVDLILKKPKLNISGKRMKKPPRKPMNGGFTENERSMQLFDIKAGKTEHRTSKEVDKASGETRLASGEARKASEEARRKRGGWGGRKKVKEKEEERAEAPSSHEGR